MKFECFKDIMKSKGYMKTRKSNDSFSIYIEVKTKKSKEAVEKIVKNDNDVWFSYDHWLEQGIGYGIGIYDINYIEEIFKKNEKRNTELNDGKKQESFYLNIGVNEENLKIINDKLSEKNSKYRFYSKKVYNQEIVQKNKELKEQEEQKIDKFLDCLMSD